MTDASYVISIIRGRLEAWIELYEIMLKHADRLFWDEREEIKARLQELRRALRIVEEVERIHVKK